MAIVAYNAKLKLAGDRTGVPGSMVPAETDDPGGGAPGKKAAGKHAAKKHPGKKGVGGRHPGKKPAESGSVHSISDARDRLQDQHAQLGEAFHHMQRAGAVISLLEAESGKDLKALLQHGIELYRNASANPRNVQCASGLLRAAEHLGMAGLYTARLEYRVDVIATTLKTVEHHLDTLNFRLDGLKMNKEQEAYRLLKMARALLKRAEASADDRHLRYELVMAADGICTALEAGL